MKTFSAKPHEVQHDWFVVDAKDKVLGRLATEIARRLRGKHKAIYTPHVDTGDYIVVVNVEKLKVTGNKAQDKMYYRHTGYPGGINETNFAKLQQRFPGRILEKAVKGMLPKGPLGYAMLKKMKCYAGGAHPHTASSRSRSTSERWKSKEFHSWQSPNTTEPVAAKRPSPAFSCARGAASSSSMTSR
jgi:large subunit ribosomal protein L13